MRGLFIGLTTIDIQYFVDTFPDSNRKIKANPPDILVGGPATNAAVAFVRLNGKAFLASAVGKNSFKSFVENDFDETGITHYDLISFQNQNPTIATVVSSRKNGDRNVFTHPPGKIEPDLKITEVFTNVKPQILLLDGFHSEVAIDAANLAKKQNIPLILDCGSWKEQYKDLLPLADVAICSSDFFPPGCNSVNDVFTFLKLKNIERAAVSRGGESILFYNGNYEGEIPVKTVKVIDTLGAGDFLHGAFCYYYLAENKNFVNALKKAAFIATKSCEYPGTRLWLNT